MGQAKQYDRDYKEEAVRLAEEKGCKNASEELGISYNTLYGWVKEARKGNLHLEKRSDSNVSKLEEELQQLRRVNKELTKENKLYTSVIFDCFDLTPLGISMDIPI